MTLRTPKGPSGNAWFRCLPPPRAWPRRTEEHLFRPLSEVDATLALTFKHRFVSVWLDASGDRPSEFNVPLEDLVDVRVAPDDEPGTQRLRITSRFSGTTNWMYEWEGDEVSALVFVDRFASDDGNSERDA